jgi:hypothetical protein
MDPVDEFEQLGSLSGIGIHPVQHPPPGDGDEREGRGRHPKNPSDADEQDQDRGQEPPKAFEGQLGRFDDAGDSWGQGGLHQAVPAQGVHR